MNLKDIAMENKRLSIDIEEKLYIALRLKAVREGVPVRTVVENALMQFIDKYTLEEARVELTETKTS